MSKSDGDQITLTDEKGRELVFDFLDLVEYKGKEYVVLLPSGSTLKNPEAVILELEEGDEGSDTESYLEVGDNETIEAVFELFKQSFANDNRV